MSNIKQAIEQLEEPSKSIGNILIEFYETMIELEDFKLKTEMQATKIVMTINHIKHVISNTKAGASPAEEKVYICPQCGIDENGSQIHALTHHTYPFCTVEQAKKKLAKFS